MAQSSVVLPQDPMSENSISTKEFLNFEKTCEAYKDSDEEIKMIFNEITKLSAACNKDALVGDVDDVDLILKRAEDIANETENLLKTNTIMPGANGLLPNVVDTGTIPQIKVTKPMEARDNEENKPSGSHKVHHTSKHNNKDHSSEMRRKPKTRPLSAGVIDTKKKETAKAPKSVTNSPKKLPCKHESLIEELKDTTERLRALEINNVEVNNDNKALKKKLDEVNEQKHLADLKLAECEKFISRIGKQYENRNGELKAAVENESRLLAELNKERNERKNLTIRHDKDAVVIKDLQRQVKEMELILRRKHPDSVSALIVASKSSTVEDNKKKLLEERISRLEQELKDKEDHFQGILITLQGKFGDMKQKYENHIIDVERQLMEERKLNTELKNKISKINLIDTAVQTVTKCQQVSTQTNHIFKPTRASSAVSRISQNSALILNKLKEDSYLVATIKGLQTELLEKQRTIAKINRETEELRKNLRNLQKEKEVLLHLNPQKKSSNKIAKSADNLLAKMNSAEAELAEAKKQREVFIMERNSLLDSLKRTNEEFIMLKKKRIQDLHTLQLAHEKELMQMNMQLYPLQEEIKLLNRTVEILQERIRASDDKLLRYQAGMKDVDIHAGGDTFSSKSSFNKKETR